MVLVYNSRLPESEEVARHYASRRGVPAGQVVGLDLPTTEEITREQYLQRLQQPLLQFLTSLRVLSSDAPDRQAGNTNSPAREIVSTNQPALAVRHLVLCYGVPVRVEPDATVREAGDEKLPAPLRRNEAAVDNELAALPLQGGSPRWSGPLPNPALGQTNSARIGPDHGLFIVARLDGPTAEIARGLVDKAIAAETSGLWGRAYFDLRGLTNTTYRAGDEWLRVAAEITRGAGFETVADEKPETFRAGFPLSHVALYAGWYDGSVSGPFRSTSVEFVPGALAYHLHSFNARSIRTANEFWVGPLLARGATATVGYVAEPYLEGTVNVGVLWARFLQSGFSFGEAVYAALPALSWQATVLGDPLYRPFGRRPAGAPLGEHNRVMYGLLAARQDPQLFWSHLHVVNLGLVSGRGIAGAVAYLEQEPIARTNSVLLEKLAEIGVAQGKLQLAIEAGQRALARPTSPQQRIRITLNLARRMALFQQDREAFDLYRTLLKEFPEYPDRLEVLQRMLPLAGGLHQTNEAARIREQIQQLTAPAAQRN